MKQIVIRLGNGIISAGSRAGVEPAGATWTQPSTPPEVAALTGVAKAAQASTAKVAAPALPPMVFGRCRMPRGSRESRYRGPLTAT